MRLLEKLFFLRTCITVVILYSVLLIMYLIIDYIDRRNRDE